MTTNGIKVNMTPSHPGDFIRTEIIEEFGSERDQGGQDSGGSAGDAFRLAERQRRVIAEDGATHREGFCREHGHAAADAGLVRRHTDARPVRRD